VQEVSKTSMEDFIYSSHKKKKQKMTNSTAITKQTSIKVFLMPSKPDPQKIIGEVLDNLMKEVFSVLFPIEKDQNKQLISINNFKDRINVKCSYSNEVKSIICQ